MSDVALPPADAGLQLERTVLAWRRLALAVLGLALASVRFTWPIIGALAVLPTAVVVATSIVVFVGVGRRYRMAEGRLGPRATLADARWSFALVAVVIMMAVIALMIALAHG